MGSIRTNYGGSASLRKLRDALQFAGPALDIDVSTATYREICDALALQYPEQLILFDPETGTQPIAGGFTGSGTTVSGAQIQMYGHGSASAANASYSVGCFSSNQIMVPRNATKLNFDITYLYMQSYNGTYAGSAKSQLYFGLYTNAWVTGAYNSSYSTNDATTGADTKTWTNQHVSIDLPSSVLGNLYTVGFAANGNCYNGTCTTDMRCNKIWFSYE